MKYYSELIKDMIYTSKNLIYDNKSLYELMLNENHSVGDNINPYHMEGNVWTHTMLVLNQAVNHENSNIELIFAAFLHDIGKPFSKKIINNKKRFTNHESVSFYLAKDFFNLFNKNFPNKYKFNEKEVLNLILFHGILQKNTIEKAYEKIKIFSKNKNFIENLINLMNCDNKGRFTEKEDAIELSKEKTKSFYKYIKEQNFEENKETKKEKKRKIILLIGPVGAGKSTFIKEFNLDKHFQILSRDNILYKFYEEIFNKKSNNYQEVYKETQKYKNDIDKELRKQYVSYLKNNENIIIDMQNITEKGVKNFIYSIPKKIKENYEIIGIVFNPGYKKLIENNLNRKKENKDLSYLLKPIMASFSLNTSFFDSLYFYEYDKRELINYIVNNNDLSLNLF